MAPEKNGQLVLRGRIGPFECSGAYRWIEVLRETGRIEVPASDRDALFEELLGLPRLPALDLPEDLRFDTVRLPPQPRIKIGRPDQSYLRGRLQAVLAFDYAGVTALPANPAQGIADLPGRRRILRDGEAERAAVRALAEAGCKPSSYFPGSCEWLLDEARLPAAVRALTAAGWRVEAEGSLFRTAGRFRLHVATGIDWFELSGTVEFGDRSAPLPALLAALRRKETTILLDDGSLGILPEEWPRKYGLLAGLGRAEGQGLRFSRCQAGLLDALLAAEPAASCDALFEQARAQLLRFEGIAPTDPPAGFRGELREYQREGLGWIHFLRDFGFGGCLADDMGLGKTVQVLALLEARRKQGADAGPAVSLVVAPRSLIFNWREEAARFTPGLRVREHIGTGRAKAGAGFGDCDLVLTTYGTMRRDAAFFKDIPFDYVVLDEAQAVDRSHRIGQTRTVFAYRLIARDTVEEKVIELQQSKRDLADAIIGADNSLCRKLRPEDLALLLS